MGYELLRLKAFLYLVCSNFLSFSLSTRIFLSPVAPSNWYVSVVCQFLWALKSFIIPVAERVQEAGEPVTVFLYKDALVITSRLTSEVSELEYRTKVCFLFFSFNALPLVFLFDFLMYFGDAIFFPVTYHDWAMFIT